MTTVKYSTSGAWGAGLGLLAPADVDTNFYNIVQDLAAALFGPVGQCYLSSSGANLVLSRVNGRYLMINGVLQIIPSAGVTLTPTATLNTFYYVYAYMNSGTMALELSTTGHSTDTTTGVEIKTGDSSRTLVGAFYCMTTNSAVITGSAINVLSWFNRVSRYAVVQNASVVLNTSSGEIATANRIVFLCWASESARHRISGSATVSTAATVAVGHTFDGVNISGGSVSVFGSAAGAGVNLSCDTIANGSAENTGHYFNMYGATNAGTATMGSGWQSAVETRG